MTTTWLIVNIALSAVVAAIVALPAVLIPLMLDRHATPRVTVATHSTATIAKRERPIRTLADVA